MAFKKLYIKIIIVLYFASAAFADRPVGPEGEILVGIFPLEPINFVDENGQAQGVYPDLLREITKDEEWTVKFVEGSWAQCLEWLENEKIDLMISVAYTEERDEVMDYNYESVLEIWGQVFLLPENKSININDLHGQKIGIMSKDISGANFINTAKSLNIESQIIEYATHGDVFEAVQKGEILGGVAPQHYGLRNVESFGLIPSTIQFSPFSIYFASKEGKQSLLLSHIDSHLIRWKENSNSFYYDTLTYWMTGKALRRNIIPMWLIITFAVISLIAILFLLFIVLLRTQVKKGTETLLRRERQYRDLMENANSIIIRINKKGHIFFVNKFGLEFIGYKEHELIGENPLGKIFSDENDLDQWINEIRVNFIDEIRTSGGATAFVQWNNKVILDDDGIIDEILCIGTDLSELKSAEKDLKETNVQLEEMVYIASHDLQVPLVSMEGYASSLSDFTPF